MPLLTLLVVTLGTSQTPALDGAAPAIVPGRATLCQSSRSASAERDAVSPPHNLGSGVDFFPVRRPLVDIFPSFPDPQPRPCSPRSPPGLPILLRDLPPWNPFGTRLPVWPVSSSAPAAAFC